MKLLTLNFLTCARKTCKTQPAAFPLHPREAELEVVETEFNLQFLVNILPRVEWEALRTICQELGLPALPESMPTPEDLVQPPAPGQGGDGKEEEEGGGEVSTQTATDLHRVLLETTIANGKLLCGACGHEYAIKEGIANFLLPSHMV